MNINKIFIDHYRVYDFKKSDIILAAVGMIVALFFYTINMTPSVSAGDNGELTTAMHFLGIAHAPGYPLHSLIGKLITYLPFHNVGWRANFFSALCGSITIYFAVLVYMKLLISCKIPRIPALYAACLTGIGYMLSESLWSQAIMCEVYTMSSIFHPLSYLILLKWLDAVIENRESEKVYIGERYLMAYAFMFGIAMAGHSTILITGLFSIPFIVFVLLVFVVLPRKMNQKQIEQGMLYMAVLFIGMLLAYYFYYRYIMRLESNLYDLKNVQYGYGFFIIFNLMMAIFYFYDKFVATDRRDPYNPVVLIYYSVIKMFAMFYLGYFVHIYMFIRAHGNPPINWMGIHEVENWWAKIGKFSNAIWRKQYGNLGKLPLNYFNLIFEYKLAMTRLNGDQFTAPIWIIILFGAVNFFRKNWMMFALLTLGLFLYNLALTPYLRFDESERALFFVKVFYIFSYFTISIYLAFGLSFFLEMINRLFSIKKKTT